MENRLHFSLLLVIPALMAVLFAGHIPAQPNSCSWNGKVDTDWGNEKNWDCNHKPGAGEDVTIPSGTPHSPTISGPEQIGYLTVSGHLSFNAQLSTSGWVVADGGQITGNDNAGGELSGDGDVSGNNGILYGQFTGVLTIESGATAYLQNVTLTNDLDLNGVLDGYDTSGTLHMRGNTFTNNGQVKVAKVYFDGQKVQHISGVGSWEESISMVSIEDGTTLMLDNDMTFQPRQFNTGVNGVNDLNIGSHTITFTGTMAPDPNPNSLLIGSHLIGTGSLHTRGNFNLDISGRFAPDLFVDTGVTLAHTSIGFDGQIQVANGAELNTNATTIIANNNVTNNGTISGSGEFRMHGNHFTNSGSITVASFLLYQYPTPSFEQHIGGNGTWTGAKVDLSTFSFLTKLDSDVEIRASEVDISRMDLQGHALTVDGSGNGGSLVKVANDATITGGGEFQIKDTVSVQNVSAAGVSVNFITDVGNFSVFGLFNNLFTIADRSTFTVPDGKTLTAAGNFSVSDNSHLRGGDLATIELRGEMDNIGQDFDNSLGTTVLNCYCNPQFIQSSDGLPYLYTKNLTVKSPNVNMFLPAVRITGMLELDGALIIHKPDSLGWPGGIVLEQTATTSGTGDVFGRVLRNGVFQLNKTYSFGNPNTSITFKNGSNLPDTVSLVINKSAADGLPTAINRSYTLSTSGGSGWAAGLRLHYRDDELKGMDEHDLQLWSRAGSSDPWGKIAISQSDFYYNWLEPAQGAIPGDWALTAIPHIFLPIMKR